MLFYDMSERGDRSLYEHLYLRLRHDIAHGALEAGEKLPSRRAFAEGLGVSTVTVDSAYSQLVAEGYVEARERSGYYVCELPPALKAESVDSAKREASRRESGKGDGVEKPSTGSRRKNPAGTSVPNEDPEKSLRQQPLIADFTRNAGATKLFPYSRWMRTMQATVLEETPDSLAEASSAAGSPRLREAVSRYLSRTRGMDVDPSQIVVGAGSQTLYQMVVQLLGHERTYAVEDPGYPLLTGMYGSCGADVAHVRMDGQGLLVDELEQSRASVAHVMPSHQFPTGTVMPAGRRRELLNWARLELDSTFGEPDCAAPEGRYIVEDDYDSEFRMTGRPMPALFSLDAAERVIHIGTFAKGMGAVLKVAYMVLPPQLVDAFGHKLGFYANTVSPLDQQCLARFIEEGHYERHVNRLRAHTRKVQDALVDALGASEEPQDALGFEAVDQGLHFVLRVGRIPKQGSGPEARGSKSRLSGLCELLLSHGVAVSPMDDCFQAAPYVPWDEPRLVMRCDGIDLDSVPAIADAFESAFRELDAQSG